MRSTAATLRRRGYRRVQVRAGNGLGRWPERVPFVAVIVTAGFSCFRTPLLNRLRTGGRLVMPIGLSTATERREVFTK